MGTRKYSDGKAVTVTAPTGGVTVNNFYLIDGFLGVCGKTADATELTTLEVANYEYETDEALSTDTFAVGEAIYWDDSAEKFTTTSTSNYLFGKATEAKAAGTGVAVIKRTTLDS